MRDLATELKAYPRIDVLANNAGGIFGDRVTTRDGYEEKYSPKKAYGNAKLENILFIKELHRRYADQGITAVAVHPGNIASNFANESKGMFKLIYSNPLTKAMLSSNDKGGQALNWLAAGTRGNPASTTRRTRWPRPTPKPLTLSLPPHSGTSASHS